MKVMLKCEGYMMFRGTATIAPANGAPYDVTGDWLYKPEYDCWYGGGRSFCAAVCEVILYA